MSLISTLAKVAAGVALAKGAQAMASRGGAGQQRSGGGLMDALQGAAGGSGGAGGLMGALQGAAGGSGSGGGGLMDALQGARSSGGGGMPDLGALLGGAGGGAGGGLGDILETLGGGGGAGGAGGGLPGGLGGLLAGGGAGAALGSLLGGAQGTEPAFGARLNQALTTGAEPESPPTADEEAMAGLMLRAMIMAAKSDGRIDEAERQNILGALQDASPEERGFVEAELAAPIDVDRFASEVPNDAGLRRQVFATALLAIDLDSQAEAEFMSDMARALNISQQDLAAITSSMRG